MITEATEGLPTSQVKICMNEKCSGERKRQEDIIINKNNKILLSWLYHSLN